MKILNKIFSINNQYVKLKKHRVIYFLGFKIKFRIKNTKQIRKFINESKPQFLDGIKPIGNCCGKVELAICTIFKNEPDIIDWIEFHRLVGVDRFYLYDNESDNDAKKILQPYIDSGVVIYHYTEGRCKQLPVYRDAALRYKYDAKWIAFLDMDEYIVPVEKNNIKDFLKDYENQSGVGINWVLFDTNGHIKRPDVPVIEAYTRAQRPDFQRHIKSIVRPEEISYITNPHFCFFRGKRLTVDENFHNIGVHNPPCYNCFSDEHSEKKIKINHYHVKSYEDYISKRLIGFADTMLVRPVDGGLYYSDWVRDCTALKYLPEHKERLKYCRTV